MTAIFTGLGSGVERGSSNILGGAGTIGSAGQGRGGDQVAVNAATGNLVISRRDEFLVGRGLDIGVSRTYNSLTEASDGDNNDQWQQSTHRRVFGLTGTQNATGSTIKRQAGDGSVITYTWNASKAAYLSTDGNGAHNTLKKVGSNWVWTDGSSRITEAYATYGSNNWRIIEQKDTDGYKLAFTYSGDKLNKVTTANGDWVQYLWSGSRITQIKTGYTDLSNGSSKTLTRTRYAYDAQGRLSTVTTDLSPTDNSVSDGRTYVTTYTYKNTTGKQVATIAQSDGSLISFNYQSTSASAKVTSITQTVASGDTRTTSLSYGSNYTLITGPDGQVTRMDYDSKKQLTKITTPPAYAGAPAQNVRFQYDSSGNVTKVTDAAGKATNYSFDSNGRVLQITDPNGNTTYHWYDSNGNLTRKRTYGSYASSSNVAQYTRYTYDSEGHLRYAISAEGFVKEYRYNGYGQLIEELEYPEHIYNTSSSIPTTSQMDSWRNGLGDRSSAKITRHYYDARGNTYYTINYASATTTGGASSADGYSRTYYTYDQAGNLLKKYNQYEAAETYVYDGLNRLVAATDVNGGTTNFVFNDAASKTVVTTASGYVTTSTFNKAGELISQTGSGSYDPTGTTTNKYDKNGRIRQTTDETNKSTYFLYDKAGRKTADINSSGNITEYRYDAAGRVNATVSYYYSIYYGHLGTLTNPNNTLEIASIRPSSHSYDVWEWNVYDSGGRVIQTIDGTGGVARFEYDKADRLVKTTSYYNKLSSSQLSAFKANAPTSLVLPSANSSRDAITRTFYDRDNRAIGQLDGEGYLTEIRYDKAGQKVEEIAYAQKTSASYWATGSFSSLRSTAAPTSSKNVRTRYVYDGQGKLRYTVDTYNRAVAFSYNYAGRLTKTVEHANTLLTSDYTFDSVKAAVASSANALIDRTTITSYFSSGQVNYIQDAGGLRTYYTYDNRGRVTKMVVGTGSTARTTRNWYTADGNLRFTVDAEGYVKRFDYDAAGRQTRVVKWSNKVVASDSTSISQISSLASAAGTWVDMRYTYDSAGRISNEYDGEGNRTLYTYNATGTLNSVYRAFGTADQSRTYYLYNGAGRVTYEYAAHGTSAQAVSYYTYDGMGNMLTSRDPRYKTTTYTYNKLGQVLTETNPAGGVTTYQYNAFGNKVKVTNPRGHSLYNYYDNMGRVVLQIDQENYATRTSYTAFGEIFQVKRYFSKATGVGNVNSQPSTTGSTATSTFYYDKMSRVTRAKDALGYSDYYTYDAFGQRTRHTNKIGGITNFTYDKRGQLISEQIIQDAHNSYGSLSASSVTNKYEYDARGNRTKMYEAWNLMDGRTTTYIYDKADRLTQKRNESVAVYDSSTDNTASTVTPIEYFTYDRRGNLIESKNALGARHLYWYDDLDRVTHEVNPTGTVSRNWYDANGNLTDTRVYSSTIALPSSATGTPPSGSGSYRRTTFIYDNLNRMTRSTVHDVQTATFGTSLSITSTTSDISINYLYDAMGNVIRTQDANGKYIHSYYDKLGRKTSQVDQERYRTDWTYDAQGNVTRERKFWNKTSTPYTSGVPSVSYNSTLDRITDFTYDLQGNRKTEKRLNVKAHNGYGGYVNVHSTVSYNYNGLGLVTRKTEATGDYIDYSYDGQGRVKYETRRSYTGHTGSSVTPKLQYFYNGLDNVSRVYQFGGGGLGAKATRYNYDYAGRLISKVDTAGFTNYYYYDKGGRLVREKYSRITATQGTKTEAIGYTYDLSDRIKQESVMRWTGSYWSKGDRTDTIYNAYGEVAQRGTNGKYSEKSDYDKAGRVWRTTMGDGTFKYFLYDKNGNQTVAFTSDGTNIDNKSMAQILAYWSVSSSGANANRIYTNYVNGVTATITKYDAKNQAIEIREPEREIRENVRYDLITKRGYNAFGETSYEIDANNARIDYTYNNMGRLTKVQSPTVSVTGLNGVKTNVRPTEQYYHDYSGRLVANRDANNNLTRQYLLAGTGYNGSQALITQITAADGGLTRTKYDIFGNAREIKDELNRVTTQSFDAMGRVTQINHAGGKRDYFQYDGLGQQIKRWNNFYGSGNAEQTDYDMQGRVVRHRAIGGDVTTHSYYWSSYYSTSGLGTFGGWNQNTTYANGKVLTERTDAFGREIYQNDLGSRTTYYNYNKAGQLIRRYGSGTEDQDYSYLNTGKINEAWGQTGTTASQNWTRLTATYQYDKVGNLKKESLVQTGQYTYEEYEYYGYGGGAGPSTTVVVNTSSTLKNATATYDALGRLKTWNESGNSITPVASRSFEYDANGNIRRSRGVHRTLSATGTASSTNKVDDYWYRYDNMNRVVTAKGVRSGSTIVRGSNGTDIYYNKAGERVYILQSFQDTAWISDGYEWDDYGYEEVFIPVNFTNTRRENYTYDSAGRLTHIRTSEGSYNETTGGVNAPSSTGTLRGRFYYDTLGRQTRQLDYLSNGSTVAYDQTRSYNQKSQVTSETTITRRGGNTYRTTSTYSYGSGSSYALGAATYISTRVFKKNSSTQTDYYSSTTNNYQWWTGAVQSSTVYRPNTSQSTTNTTSYYYSAGGTLQRAYVADGRARNVDFTVDQNGQVIRRDERDNRYSYGDPHEVWYRFGGKEMGYIGNNGTLNVSHAQSISTRTASQGTGAFRNGSNYGSIYADFDQAYGAINSFSQGSTGGLYSVNRGDTLQSVAANVYGDSSLWYKIAEANGMTGQSQLSVGQKLVLPTGVVKSSHNANTFKAYDPSETIGDLNPTTPEPPKASKKKCGVLGAILLVVVAVAVTIVTAGAAAAVLAPTSMTLGAGISAAVTGTLAAKAGVAAAIAGGVIGGAVGSVASQAVGVATGIQDKFSWKAVALAGISGGVGAGVGTVIKGTTAVKAALRGAVTSATTQGIGVATGLQEKFSWAAVAASGVSSGVSVAAGAAFGANSFVADQSVGNIAANVLATSASSISYAATKSLIDGSNFGDNVLSSVPDIVGSTLANFFAGAMTNNRIERIVNTIHRKANIPGKPEDTQISREVVAEMLARGASKEDIIWMLNETAVGDALRDFNVTRGEGITADESGARADYILEEYGAKLKAASSGGGPAGAGAKTTAETTDQTEQVMDGGKLEEIVVYGKRGKGPSGETIVSKTISGGVKLVDGLVTLQEKRPLLANILYNSAGFVAGGPTKSLASKAAGVIFDGAKDTATDWIAGKAEGYITGLAEDYGWELDFSIMDKKIHVGAEQIGLGGGQLTGIVADFIFGNGLDSVVKKGHKARTGIIEHAPRVRKVNGRLPINSRKYAGRTVPLSDMPKHLRGKYPHSVTFTGDGFPDFSRYSKKNVRIELGKSRSTDFRRADKAAGFNASNPRPEGFTWHHHQDSGRMQLVPTDLHDWLKHTGGVATNK